MMGQVNENTGSTHRATLLDTAALLLCVLRLLAFADSCMPDSWNTLHALSTHFLERDFTIRKYRSITLRFGTLIVDL